MSDKDFVNSYLKDFSSLLKPNEDIVDKIENEFRSRESKHITEFRRGTYF